ELRVKKHAVDLRYGKAYAVEELLKMLIDTNLSTCTRLEVIRILGQTNDARVIKFLTEMLKEGIWPGEVYQEIVRVLGCIGNMENIKLIFETMEKVVWKTEVEYEPELFEYVDCGYWAGYAETGFKSTEKTIEDFEAEKLLRALCEEAIKSILYRSSVSELVGIFEQVDRSWQMIIMEILGNSRTEDQKAIEILIAKLNSDNRNIRQIAYVALAKLDKLNVELKIRRCLIDLESYGNLSSEVGNAKRELIELVLVSDNRIVELLMLKFNEWSLCDDDKYEAARGFIIGLLGKFCEERVEELLIRTLIYDRSFFVRETAGKILINSGIDKIKLTNAYIQMLDSHYYGAREKAVTWLVEDGYNQIQLIDLLINIMNDSDYGTITLILDSLGKLGANEDQMIRAYKKGLENPDRSIWTKMVENLDNEGIDISPQISLMFKELETPNTCGSAHGICFRLLEKWGYSITQLKVKEYIGDLRHDTRFDEAVCGLGDIGPEAREAVSTLVELYQKILPELGCASIVHHRAVSVGEEIWPDEEPDWNCYPYTGIVPYKVKNEIPAYDEWVPNYPAREEAQRKLNMIKEVLFKIDASMVKYLSSNAPDHARPLPGQPMLTKEYVEKEVVRVMTSADEEIKKKIKTIECESSVVQAVLNYLRSIKEEAMANYLEYLAKQGLIRVGPFKGFLATVYTNNKKEECILLSNLYQDYFENPVQRAASLIHEIGATSKFGKTHEENEQREKAFIKLAQTPFEEPKPMILSIHLPDWDEETHCGSLLATPFAYELAKEEALRKYGKDLDAFLKEGKVRIAVLHDAGAAKRCSPLSQSQNNSRGDIKVLGTLRTPKGKEVPLTLQLAVAIQNSIYANADRVIDVHYVSQLYFDNNKLLDYQEIMDSEKSYAGYDVFIVTSSDPEVVKLHEQTFEDVFGSRLINLQRKEGEEVNNLLTKFVIGLGDASSVREEDLRDLGIYLSDDKGN
ncbi:MAG: hypothetical protein Q7S42_01485, partial [Candidatus Omnitrophota bacterium]|nr:hypothetical protein [Candidatus Omnitrophota bacterium]